MKISALAAALLLAGCAPSLTSINDTGGIVTRVRDTTVKEALLLANAECQKTGKVAKLTGRDMLAGTITYECVAP